VDLDQELTAPADELAPQFFRDVGERDRSRPQVPLKAFEHVGEVTGELHLERTQRLLGCAVVDPIQCLNSRLIFSRI
jgi:hypothetical protein